MGSPRASAIVFDPQRLRLARRAAGFRKKELAQRLEVSAASITQYEAGRTVPRPSVLAQMALVLRCPVEYFRYDPNRRRPLNASTPFFRSLRSTRLWERDQAEAWSEQVWDVVAFLEEYVKLPALSVHHPELPHRASRAEIEATASEVREAWDVPPGPVANVVRLLEANGVVVARLRSNSPRLDAFSRWFDDRPVVILWDGKDDKPRSRFDAAHELAHLALHHDPEAGNPVLERQAHAFASAFLMPSESVESELPRRAPREGDWMSLLETKARWGVSMASLFYRARELGTISESGFRRAMVRLSERGWRTSEPDDLGPCERPLLLRTATDLVLESEGISLEDLAARLAFTVEHVEQILGASKPTVSLGKPVDMSRFRETQAG